MTMTAAAAAACDNYRAYNAACVQTIRNELIVSLGGRHGVELHAVRPPTTSRVSALNIHRQTASTVTSTTSPRGTAR